MFPNVSNSIEFREMYTSKLENWQAIDEMQKKANEIAKPAEIATDILWEQYETKRDSHRMHENARFWYDVLSEEILNNSDTSLISIGDRNILVLEKTLERGSLLKCSLNNKTLQAACYRKNGTLDKKYVFTSRNDSLTVKKHENLLKKQSMTIFPISLGDMPEKKEVFFYALAWFDQQLPNILSEERLSQFMKWQGRSSEQENGEEFSITNEDFQEMLKQYEESDKPKIDLGDAVNLLVKAVKEENHLIMNIGYSVEYGLDYYVTEDCGYHIVHDIKMHELQVVRYSRHKGDFVGPELGKYIIQLDPCDVHNSIWHSFKFGGNLDYNPIEKHESSIEYEEFHAGETGKIPLSVKKAIKKLLDVSEGLKNRGDNSLAVTI
jgi:Ca2+-binding EF-hand superfamily protein